MQDVFGVNPKTGQAYLGDAANAQGLDSLFAANAADTVLEPESYALLLAGLGLVGFTARRRIRK